MRLVAEWLQTHRAEYWYQQRVRLGPLPNDTNAGGLSDAEQRLVHNAFARWADAIVELPDRTEVIEAKIVASPGAVGQLNLYAELLPQTPSLSHRRGFPVTKVLLYAVPDAMVLDMARRQGIMLAQYTAPWIDEYLSRQAARKRTAPRPQFSTEAAT
jgi:hypothetical protein